MLSPVGRLVHHPFCALYWGQNFQVRLLYDKKSHFRLPDLFDQYMPCIQAYWLERGRQLDDAQSIVHLEAACSFLLKGELFLQCSPASYFQFLATNYSLDVLLGTSMTLRSLQATSRLFEKFRQDKNREGCPYFFPKFGNSVGLTISVVTADNHLIITQRAVTPKLACDQGCLMCAVGTQIKRHRSEYLDSSHRPHPDKCVRCGLRDELGAVVAETCNPPVCRGLVYRIDCQHCDLLYEATSSLKAADFIDRWQNTVVLERDEAEGMSSICIDEPTALLELLCDPGMYWSPQHAAGALFTLSRCFPQEVAEAGLDLTYSS